MDAVPDLGEVKLDEGQGPYDHDTGKGGRQPPTSVGGESVEHAVGGRAGIEKARSTMQEGSSARPGCRQC